MAKLTGAVTHSMTDDEGKGQTVEQDGKKKSKSPPHPLNGATRNEWHQYLAKCGEEQA